MWILGIIRGGNYFFMLTLLLILGLELSEKFDFDLLRSFATWRIEQIKRGEQPPSDPTVDQPNVQSGE